MDISEKQKAGLDSINKVISEASSEIQILQILAVTLSQHSAYATAENKELLGELKGLRKDLSHLTSVIQDQLARY